MNWILNIFYNKTKGLYALLGSFSSFFMPLQELILWTFIFVMLDLITGIWASLNRGIVIQSFKLRSTVQKIVFLIIMIIGLEAIDKDMITFKDLHLAEIGCALLCGIELYSILENAYKITGLTIFKVLTQYTRKKIKDVSGVDINDNS